MKLFVIGHSVLDFIKSDKIEKVSAGGIFYTISALNRLKQNEDEIFLSSQYDDETYNYFKTEFEKINNQFLLKVDKIPKVHLYIQENKERRETYENISNTLSIDIKNLNEFDGILINMITGFDITIEQLKELRKNFSGLIFMDVHTFSRGLNEGYKREYRLIPDFINWAACLDIIQVNENELFTISEKKTELEIAEEILNTGVKILCVTKGELGAKIFYHHQSEIVSYFITANKINNPNVVGCGDIFGASFFYSYIRNKNAINSLSTAVTNAEQFVANKFLI